MTAPPPPVPPEADLRPLPFMPLHVAKLRDSDLAAECEPEACWYAVLLWCAAWHQLPAGSLPDSDTVLCKLIGLGRDLKTWRAHREQALRGWYLASDGRLYHPTVAGEVVKAWQGRVEQAHRTECARIKKANQRNGTDLPTPSLEDFIANRAPLPVPKSSQGTLKFVPEDTANSPEGQGGTSPATTPNVPRENPSKGERERERQGERERDSNIPTTTVDSAAVDGGDAKKADPIAASPRALDLAAIADGFARRAGIPNIQPTPIARNVEVVREWLNDGIDLDGLLGPIIDRHLLDKPDDRVASLRFFDQSLRRAHARKAKPEAKGYTTTMAAPPVAQLGAKDADDDRVRMIRSHLGAVLNASPDKVALSVEADDDGPFLVVTARSRYVADHLDKSVLRQLARRAGLADAEFRLA